MSEAEVDVRVRKLWCNSACGGGRRRRLEAEAEAEAEADVDVRVRINNIKISCGVVVEVVGKHRASPRGVSIPVFISLFPFTFF